MDAVLNAMKAFKDHEIYYVGPHAQRVSFSGQQYRAYALLYALYKTNERSTPRSSLPLDGKKVAVIGSSITGMTMAAGLSRLGANVDLYDSTSLDNHYLSHCSDYRFINPTINFLPKEPLSFTIELPFMYWWSRPASEIFSCLKKEILRLENERKLRFHPFNTIDHININPEREQDKYALVKADGTEIGDSGFPKHFDKVIVCTGFSPERDHSNFPNNSYWKGPHRMEGKDYFFVLGDGDGGIIDSIYYAFGWTTKDIFHTAMRFSGALMQDESIKMKDESHQIDFILKIVSADNIFCDVNAERVRNVFLFKKQEFPSRASVWHKVLLKAAAKEGIIKEIELKTGEELSVNKKNSSKKIVYPRMKNSSATINNSIVEIRRGAEHSISVLTETRNSNEVLQQEFADHNSLIANLKTKEFTTSELIQETRQTWGNDPGFIKIFRVLDGQKLQDASEAIQSWRKHYSEIYPEEKLGRINASIQGNGLVVTWHCADGEKEIEELPGMNKKVFDLDIFIDQPEKSWATVQLL